ncbi:hypothetical protein M6B38_233880 [Iris pallida]|uniref:Uncharacterized protein n=1 Tax=Iris pallida TaxID=29817 RepID=A0AAX6DQ70_IRIPA|nr:hypothetical protein M6B38_233880 [Iris pallida]
MWFLSCRVVLQLCLCVGLMFRD